MILANFNVYSSYISTSSNSDSCQGNKTVSKEEFENNKVLNLYQSGTNKYLSNLTTSFVSFYHIWSLVSILPLFLSKLDGQVFNVFNLFKCILFSYNFNLDTISIFFALYNLFDVGINQVGNIIQRSM